MMGMFVCLDCGRKFEIPVRIVEKHGWDYPPYEEYDGCPYCAGAIELLCEDYDADEWREM